MTANSLSVAMLIWGIVLLILGLAMFVIGYLYLKKGKMYHDTKRAMLIEAEQRVKLQYNKIATMTPNQLTVYLGGIFSRYLELNGELNSEHDNTILERLFTQTQADLLEYLGQDTVNAIEYYYGSGYIEKWCQLAYFLLEKRKRLSGIVQGSATYGDIERTLSREMDFSSPEGQ